MKSTTIFKKILGIFSICLLTFTIASAADLEKSYTVCDIQTIPIDLGENIAGVNLTPQGGQWQEVDPNNTTTILDDSASNIFIAIDRQPGKYTFIYTATNNSCIADGKTVKVTVEILETPKPLNIRVLLCPNDSKDINLLDYVTSSLKTKYPNGIKFKDHSGSEIANGVLQISNDFEGVFQGIYEITSTIPCNASSSITVEVVRESNFENMTFEGEKIFCITTLPSSINLNNELGLAGNGIWNTTGTLPVAPNGVVDLSGSVVGTYTYNYVFSGGSCGLDGKQATYTINITDDLSDELKSNTLSLCKVNTPNKRINMIDALGISIPINSGQWTLTEKPNPSSVDITDGIFEVQDALAGTYSYKFSVSNAVDICGLTGKSAILELIIEAGGRLFDGEVQICSANLPNNLLLSEYIAGLTPSTTKWFDSQGVNEITNGQIDPSTLSVGTHKFIYKSGSSECKSEGILYVTIADKLSNFADKTVKYCLTDAGADAIKLNQVLGIAGVSGVWTNDNNATNFNTSTNVFDGKAEGKGTYTFSFKANSSAGCGLDDKTTTVTVIITDELIP